MVIGRIIPSHWQCVTAFGIVQMRPGPSDDHRDRDVGSHRVRSMMG